MKTYPMPTNFDGAKFALRYGLSLVKIPPDFWSSSGLLYVPDNLPDDPPIFEASDPFIPIPPGVKVHHWPELVGWVGNKKITAQENGTAHHECYYVIADNEVALNNLAAMPYVSFEVGQPAYLKDKLALVTWDGTKWK